MFDVAVNLFSRYVGTGMMFSLTLLAVIYLFVTQKDKTVRAVLVLVPLMSLVFFFLPGLGSLVGKVVGEQAFFRFLWMIPNAIIVAFASVDIISKAGTAKKILAGISMAVLIMVCGELIYTSPDYEMAENIYHLPQPVVDICDDVIIPGREVMVAFPRDMILYVRQYSTKVCMPYGRDAYINMSDDELYDMMNADEINIEDFTYKCIVNNTVCHYIVLEPDQRLTGDIEKTGYEFYKEIDGYILYKNTDQNFDLIWRKN